MQLFGTQVLQTNRLTLRQFTPNDISDSYTNWASDTSMCAYLSWQAHSSIEVTTNVINKWITNYSDPNFLQWAIIINDTNHVIGTISAVNINNELETIELGYCIGNKFWHKGYSSEALSLALNYLFMQCNVNRVTAKHWVENVRSGKVMQRCGMLYEGKTYQSYKNNKGEYIDMIHYGLTKNHYILNKGFDISKYHDEIISNCNSLLSDD